MKIGIGITTRNRPKVLKAALNHHLHFPISNSKFVIVDDNSDPVYDYNTVVEDFLGKTTNEVLFRKSNKRLGVAKAKNACLYKLQDCDHVFLFDDDTWPIAFGWAKKWITTHLIHNIGHSMFNITNQSWLSTNPDFQKVVWVASSIGHGKTEIVELGNSFGALLYYSNKCLKAIGGMDPTAPHIYGYEHCQHSLRAAQAGFTAGKNYLVPVIGDSLIYSVDMNYSMLKQLPPLEVDCLESFSSSVTPEESAKAGLNTVLLRNIPIYIPLEDPMDDD